MDKSQADFQVDLNALDILLDSIAKSTADPNMDRPSLYKRITEQIVACTESLGAMIVAHNSEGQVRVLSKSGLSQLSKVAANELKQLIGQSPNAREIQGEQELKQTRVFCGRADPRNGLSILFVLVRNKEDSMLANQVFVDLTAELAQQLEAFENLRIADRKPKSLAELTRIAQFVQNLGKSRNLNEMSYHLVNDLASIVDAERVWYVSSYGKIWAVSGTSQVSKRTALARSISTIARLSLASQGMVEWEGGDVHVDGSPRQMNALKLALQKLESPEGVAIPVRATKKNKFVGVVLMEFAPQEGDQRVERRELVNETFRFATPVLARSASVNSIPGIGKLDFFFNQILTSPVRALLAMVTLLSLLAAAFYFLFAVQRPFEIFVQGNLQTVRQQHLFSPIEGEVHDLRVKEGDRVDEGSVVIVMTSDELDQNLVVIGTELAEAEQRLRNLKLTDISPNDEDADQRQTQVAAEIELVKIRVEGLKAKREYWRRKQEQMEVVAPMKGQVITPNLRERLSTRPLNRGDILLTISDMDGPWELEILIPDSQVEFILAMQEENAGEPLDVRFRLASDSKKMFVGQLRELDFRTEATAESEVTYARGFVDIDEDSLGEALRLGTRVYGKIDCGERNNFFLFTYELRNQLREWFFF